MSSWQLHTIGILDKTCSFAAAVKQSGGREVGTTVTTHHPLLSALLATKIGL